MSTPPSPTKGRWASAALTLLLALSAATVQAGPDDLEGDAGHAAAAAAASESPAKSGADALEGDAGNAPVSASGIECSGQGPCLEARTRLPLRVLPRPFSHLYKARQANPKAVVQANLPAFRPLYAFAREGVDLKDPAAPKGWYQVGPSAQAATGWMQAADVLEWRQALTVSYTHPGNEQEGRRPVLMFDTLRALKAVVGAADRAGSAERIYQSIGAGQVPSDVVSMEPKRFVDITQSFYILPILDWEQTSIQGDDVRLLRLAAAVPGARGADTLADQGYRQQATVGRSAGAGVALQELKVDVVFVMDTTRSMQPYIDQTRLAVAAMAKRFSGEIKGRVRFGLVGYRDSVNAAPKLEYTSRNFTPDLVDAETLVRLLNDEGKATAVGSLDYAEEVFAGVDTALRSRWTEEALRFVVLVGDASSHPRGHGQNTTGKDETDLRREAEDLKVHLLAIHLKDARAAEDHDRAQAQFLGLSQVRGSASDSALVEVDAFKPGDFEKAVGAITNGLLDRLGAAARGTVAAEVAPAAEPDAPDAPDVQVQAQQALGKVWEASLIEYLGKGATPPKDITAWAADRDLANPADPSLEVRVLVTREQLSDLLMALDRVAQAFMRAEVTQSQFFDALQSVAGQAMKRPDEIAAGGSLAERGLLPAYLETLPYRSDILSLNNEQYASMTAEQRSQLEWSVLAKLKQYRAINEQVDAWQRLNPDDPNSEQVYPLQLDFLP